MALMRLRTGLSRYWHGSLAVQSAAMMLGCLVAAQWVSVWAFCDERAAMLREAARDAAVREVALIAALAPDDPAAFARDGLTLWGSDGRPDQLPSAIASAFETPDRAFAAWATPAPALTWTEATDGISVAALDNRAVVLSAPLAGGDWLNAAVPMPRWTDPWATQSWSSLIFTSFALMLAALLISHRVTASLRALGAAAQEFAGGSPSPVPEDGPQEVNRTLAAFNAMQERISGLLSERTRMLSALGHDLRTPMTRMRLRVHLVEEEDLREPVLRDLDEIERLTDRALDLARGTAPEKFVDIDPRTLVTDLAADLDAAGIPTPIDEVADVRRLHGRPDTLRRAVTNLAENAHRYGGGGRLALEVGDGIARIVVRDRGPGIPEARLSEVREPFVRLERSRARHTGGSGLGLALADAAAREHGGRLVLRNQKDVGLEAAIELPIDTMGV